MTTPKHPVHKAAAEKSAPKHAPAKTAARKERYREAVGRRKTAAARVRVVFGGHKGSEVTINGRPLAVYFPMKKHQDVVVSPFEKLGMKDYSVSAHVSGGGVSSQAESVRLGISRTLVVETPTSRPQLKSYGFLKRDPRKVERKKAGSRKARRPQQWRKR